MGPDPSGTAGSPTGVTVGRVTRGGRDASTGATAGVVAPPRPTRTRFHGLAVNRVDRLCSDATAITLEVPDDLSDVFDFRAGQYLTVRRRIDGREERRDYSLCSPAGRPPRIGVREVADGVMSRWLVREVRAGDVLEVAAPAGNFSPDADRPGHHVLVGAGSGITPLLSIAGTLLAGPGNRVTLLYGNRRAATAMFTDEIADLKDAHTTTFQVVHVLSREPHEVQLFTGRLDRDKLLALLPLVGPAASVDHWWLCGPWPMVTQLQATLAEVGVPAVRVHRELFYIEDTPQPVAHHPERHAAAHGAQSNVTVILDGRSTTLTVEPGTTILQGAQQVRPDVPFACQGGVCGTCRALLTHGSVHMRRNFALEKPELDAGFVLTCQSEPTSDAVTVDYDR